MMMAIPKQPIVFRLILMSIIFEHYLQLHDISELLAKPIERDNKAPKLNENEALWG